MLYFLAYTTLHLLILKKRFYLFDRDTRVGLERQREEKQIPTPPHPQQGTWLWAQSQDPERSGPDPKAEA